MGAMKPKYKGPSPSVIRSKYIPIQTYTVNLKIILAFIEKLNHIIPMENNSTFQTTAAFIREHFYTKNLPHLDENQQAEYDTLRTRLFDEIEPHNALEHQMFEQLVHAAWQLDRSRSLEDIALFNLTSDADNPQLQRQFNNFQRNRRALDRTIAAATNELRRLIATRILAVPINCNTLFTTNTDAKVPTLLDLQKTLPPADLRPQRNVLSLALAQLKNPDASFTSPEAALNRIQSRSNSSQ
jgi:hypothetical protein